VKARAYESAGSMFAQLAPEKLASLLFALSFMLACWLVGYLMDRRRLYVKV
jgi:predicted acyltransferase